jgi:WXG100 protein secretion system (Wss), protein YukD
VNHRKVDQIWGKHMNEHATVKITIQSTRGTKEFTFSEQTKVAEVIATAVQAFGFAPGDKFELVLASHAGEPLRPERTLVSYHITDGTILILTAVGGGV